MKTPPCAGCALRGRCARPPASATRSSQTSNIRWRSRAIRSMRARTTRSQYWAEFLMPEHAKAIAYYDHPFFGKWPAITENEFGAGTLLYEGTYLSDKLQTAVLQGRAGEARPDRARSATARRGARAARRQPPGQAAALLLQLLRRGSQGRLSYGCGNQSARRQGSGQSRRRSRLRHGIWLSSRSNRWRSSTLASREP